MEEVPPDWKTNSQFADEWNVSKSHSQRLLSHGVGKGVIEQKKFRIQTQNRGIYPTPHYRLKK